MAHLQKQSTSATPLNSNAPRPPTKPVTIYRRGKPITHAVHESDSEDDQQDQVNQPGSSDGEHERENASQKPTAVPIISLETTTFDRPPSSSGSSSSSSDDDDDDSTAPNNASKKLSKATSTKAGESDSDPEDTSSSDSEAEDSSDEENLVPLYKPVFITKRNRENGSGLVESEEVAEKKRIEEEERRKKASQKLVEETLVRELADREVEEVFPDVDDTDGLDPEAEFEAWRLRELKRLRRDREALIQRAKEKEELEARRMRPEEERLKEDLEYAEQTRKAKPKGQQAFLQKYHHKGAFYADSEILKKHDYTAPTEGTFTKMELLPAVMQVRDFGKMSRTKWTHLAKEDTTSFDAGWSQKKTSQGGAKEDGCFNCGERGHVKRECPNNSHPRRAGQGSNNIELGSRNRDQGAFHKRRAGENERETEYPSKRREAGRETSRDRRGTEGSRHRDRGRDHRGRDSERSRDTDPYQERDCGRDGEGRDHREREQGGADGGQGVALSDALGATARGREQ